MEAVGLTCTTAILGLLTATGYLFAGREHRLPAILALEAADGLGRLLVDEELGTLHANTAKHLEQHIVELDVVHGAGEGEVTKVSGAIMIVLAARAAQLTVLENTHSRVR